MIVRFHPRAREEVIEAAKYYRDCAGLEIARAFLAAYRDARRLIEDAPEHWRLRSHGTRRVNLKRFPYYIAYLYLSEEDCIWIVAIAHASRRPFYWKERLVRALT